MTDSDRHGLAPSCIRIHRTPETIVVHFNDLAEERRMGPPTFIEESVPSLIVDLDHNVDLITGLEIISYGWFAFGRRNPPGARETIPDVATWDPDSDCLYVELNRDRATIPFRTLTTLGCTLTFGPQSVLASILIALPPAWRHLEI